MAEKWALCRKVMRSSNKQPFDRSPAERSDAGETPESAPAAPRPGYKLPHPVFTALQRRTVKEALNHASCHKRRAVGHMRNHIGIVTH